MGTIPARAKNIIRVQHRCWVKMYRKEKRGHHQQLARKNKRIYIDEGKKNTTDDRTASISFYLSPSSTLLLPSYMKYFLF